MFKIKNQTGHEAYRRHLAQRLVKSNVPEAMHYSLIMYIADGQPVGQFLTAVLSNDLKEACNRADDINKHRLYDFVFFLHNYAPALCWGSKENVSEWLQRTEPAYNFD